MTRLPGDEVTDPDSPHILPLSFDAHHGAGDATSLADLIAGIVADLSGAAGMPGGVAVTLDVGHCPAVDIDAAVLRRMFEPLLHRSIGATTAVRGIHRRRLDVVITGIRCADAVEIEFGDSGSGLTMAERVSVAPRSLSAGRRGGEGTLAEVRRLAATVGGTLSATDCPDGGSAVTLRLPIRRPARRLAA